MMNTSNRQARQIMSPSILLVKFLIAFCFVLQNVTCTSFIDPMKHDLQIMTEKNFGGKVTKFRQSFVFVIFAYTNLSESKKFILGELNDLAAELKGMVTVGVVDCNQWKSFCTQSFVKKAPALIIYPVLPIPQYQYEGEMKKDNIIRVVLPLIPSINVRKLHKKNFESFLSESLAVPKVILFSEKPKSPPLYNALSNSFHQKLIMGYVDANNEESKSIITKYNVKKFPHLLVITNNKKIEVYKGELNFREIHDWLNVFSETFVMGGGFSDVVDPQEAQPWLVQKIPEMTKKSRGDICFSKGKGLCVIYLKSGDIEDEEIAMLESLQVQFTPKLADRGPSFRWMWMNANIEKKFSDFLQIRNNPSVVVFNPHKRIRYTKLPEDQSATRENIEGLLNKITGGDMRFTNVGSKGLPVMSDRDDEENKTKATKDEL